MLAKLREQKLCQQQLNPALVDWWLDQLMKGRGVSAGGGDGSMSSACTCKSRRFIQLLHGRLTGD